MTDRPPNNDPRNTGQFLDLFARHSRRIYSYILTLVPASADADDVFSETSVILWEKFDEFEPGTSFGAWACRVAYFCALNHYKQRRRDPQFVDEQFLQAVDEQIQQRAAEHDDWAERRHEALTECLKQLTPRQQQIVEARYEGGSTTLAVAERFSTTANAIRKTLARAHRVLLRCIEGKLDDEEGRP